ncbi:MAG: hypothetical protein KDC98_21205, partial [Planctomycetes bacterium]|nr:hypothetical protein [Planctomycetota bacterium]
MRRFHSLVIATASLMLAAFATLPGSPRWAFDPYTQTHYIATLHTISFPAGSLADVEARRAIQDWTGLGATSFRAGYNRGQPNYANNFDGINTWVWIADSDTSWDARTVRRYSGSQILECDVQFNVSYYRGWSYGNTDPSAYQTATGPADVRAVARRMMGEALGLIEHDGVLCNMNGTPTPGSGVQHAPASSTSVLPHADDRYGCRWLYPGSGTTTNLMATSWREPAPGSSVARRIWITGTWPAGSSQGASCYLENQGNTTVHGSSGLRTSVYLSTDSTITTSDLAIGQFTWNDWPAHASGFYDQSALPVYVPANTPAGGYYLGIIHDSTNVVAEQWENDNTCVVGFVQVTNAPRDLQVYSSDPSSGVSIGSSAVDLNNRTSVTTPGSFRFTHGTITTLTAPATVGGRTFRRWRLDGAAMATGQRQLQVSMNAPHQVTAEFRLAGTTATHGYGCSTASGPLAASANATATAVSGVLGNPVSYALLGSTTTPALADGVEFLARAALQTSINVDLHVANATGPVGPRLARGVMQVDTSTNWYRASFAVPVTVPASFALVFENPHPLLEVPVAASGTPQPHCLRFGPAGSPWVGPLQTQPWAWRLTTPTVAAMTPALSYAGVPEIGRTYQVLLGSAPARSLAILTIGRTQATTSLLNYGAPGCTLFVTPENGVLRTVQTNGTASYAETIPVITALIGTRLHHQWLVASP